MIEEAVTITNENGIHARPAADIAKAASGFKSKIQIIAKGKAVNAKSIIMLMSIGLSKGTTIILYANGPDEAAAINELKRLMLS